ncbi:hypothetical protein, partial [Achromobacter spanius]|uniref:hypothetical protein n=1 Tax=Achromobacter spanius TaxID=217203 RepID=UPI003F68C2A2
EPAAPVAARALTDLRAALGGFRQQRSTPDRRAHWSPAMEHIHILYALSKQVPDMAREVRIETSYGELALYGADARKVAALVERLLRAKLKQAERNAAKER